MNKIWDPQFFFFKMKYILETKMFGNCGMV